MGDNETVTADVLFEAGEAYGGETGREIVKDEVLSLFDDYIQDLSAGSGLDNSSIRIAVIHLRQLRNKVDSGI